MILSILALVVGVANLAFVVFDWAYDNLTLRTLFNLVVGIFCLLSILPSAV